MRKKILGLMLSCLLVLPLAACGTDQQQATSQNNSSSTSTTTTSSTNNEKQTVRIGLCVQAMQEGIPDLIREKFPEVNFEFTLANNSASYYEYLDEHDDLPDIITVRRFSLRDSLELKDKLVDVSQTDLAASYYQNYLQNYTFEDGTVNWLPATAEIWSLGANKTLFEENGIDIPTDYDSFIAACKAFEEKGIQGFTSDWEYDYTALETLEGFNANALQSIDGKRWRTNYESGEQTTLDETVWPTAFDHMYEMLKDTGNLPENADDGNALIEQTFADVKSKFDNREVAMIRTSGSEIAGYNERNSDEYIMLPYFGSSESENWVLTYPYFQAAMNKDSKVDSSLLMEIYTYLLGQDCSDALDMKSNVLSYSSNVKVEQNEFLDNVQKYIKENQVFTRLANADFFTAAQDAVQGMITGKYDATAAYDAFNEALKAADTKEVDYDLNFDKTYEYAFDAQHGSQSCSAILNSCREVWGTDLAVSYSTTFSNSIYAGKASTSELSYYLAGSYGSNYYLELTGAQIKAVVSAMVNYKGAEGAEGAEGLSPVTDDMLPVSSGFEMQVTDNGNGSFTLDGLTVDGQEMSDDATYTIVVSIPSFYAKGVLSQVAGIDIPDDSTKKVDTMPKTLKKYFEDTSKQWAEPTDYITLKTK